ncbi:E3 ubiquitin-protein ligase TRIM47-like [Pseudochaenichthys georgianus]|uniref:E3 ubiquitin-protein ligase TRIM47-like n=1 Tax=Pseudochaenichthys georgianus TaxID=52239 RepID=UPI00146F8D77|nr:E3 ubiquitin-protein ligase TRIM47-like [Pseudochaenichthys georgianus]
MIKNYPTQSSIDVDVSGVSEKISDVKRSVGHKKARKRSTHPKTDSRAELATRYGHGPETLLTEDQFQCSIRLEVFTEPVTIPCGHNSCKACLTRHWEGKDLCKCPLCNEKFPKDLKLRVNTGFREVVENVKELNAKADNACVKPGEVPCDCCPDDNQSKASKTCLVCLTSFCETHIEPHLRVAALKRHTLTNPVHNLEDQICKKHNRMLERFCRNDQTCVCVLCTEHSTHDTVPLEEAYVDNRAQIGRKKKAEVQEMKHKHGKRAHKNKNTSQGKAEAMENNTVIHNMNNPPTWGIQDCFGRVALNGVLPSSGGRVDARGKGIHS